MKIFDAEIDKISEITGVPVDMVKRVIAYLNMTEPARKERERQAQLREDHDL